MNGAESTARQALPGDLAGESKFQWLTRVGFLARGLLYILIGVLVIGTGRTEDLAGALEYVGHGAGRLMLMVIAAGLATYGLWRLSDAAFGIEHGSGTAKALRKRAAAAGIGFIYLFLSYKAVRVLFSKRAEAPGETQRQADTVLDLPGGEWVLGLVALIMAAAAATQLIKSVKCSFLLKLDADALGLAAKWLGRLGYAARGVIFACVALLLARAAIDRDSNEAGGLEQALDLLSGPTLYAVAAGLMLFGAFSIIEARYRRIHNPPPPEEIGREVREKVGG